MSTLPKTEWIIKNSIEIYGKLEITINVLRDEHFNIHKKILPLIKIIIILISFYSMHFVNN